MEYSIKPQACLTQRCQRHKEGKMGELFEIEKTGQPNSFYVELTYSMLIFFALEDIYISYRIAP